MKKMIKTGAFIGGALFLTACVSHEKPAANIALENCAIQQTLPGAKATGAFLTVKKNDDAPMALVAAKAPSVTDHVEIHEMIMGNGTMKMSQIKSYPLNKGDNVFKKGSYHIMLMGLSKPLAVGEKHELSLMFDNGSSASCIADVKSVEALTPKSMKNMKHMKHMKKHMHN